MGSGEGAGVMATGNNTELFANAVIRHIIGRIRTEAKCGLLTRQTAQACEKIIQIIDAEALTYAHGVMAEVERHAKGLPDDQTKSV